MTMTDLPPTALHRGEHELPFVDIGDGATLQLPQVGPGQRGVDRA